jgi:hypothetical protein
MKIFPTRVLSLLPILLLASIAAPSHAQQITLKPSFQVGQAWNFDVTQDSNSDNKATKDGQTQPFNSKTHSHHTGKMEVVAVQNGLPTSLRISFDAGCEDSSSFADQPAQPTPFAYAGKTITITRGDNGDVTDDFNDKADASSIAGLHAMLDEEAVFFPNKPVAVGEEWSADPQILSRALQLAGNDRAGMTLKLLSVDQTGARPTAEVKVSIVAMKTQGQIQSKVILQGTSVVDLQTGHAIKSDLKGTIDLQGQQTANGPDGQPATYQVSGSGTLTTAGTADFISADAGAPPASNTPVATGNGPGPAFGTAPTPPAGVNPLAPPPSFTGKFANDTLTLDGSDSNGDFQGSIQLGQTKYPAKARVNGQSLNGTFDAGGSSFPFTATLDGDTVSVVSGGKTYTLKRSVPAPVNPLDPGAGAP